jgi:hypothetical protein
MIRYNMVPYNNHTTDRYGTILVLYSYHVPYHDVHTIAPVQIFLACICRRNFEPKIKSVDGVTIGRPSAQL